MMIVAHNIAAMNAERVYKINSDKTKKSTEKLSSGYRINRSADDAAGLSISEKMRKQIRGLDQGSENAQDGISYCQVADGALAETLDMMHRITELSVQSANGTNSESDRAAIQKEVRGLLVEMDRIADTTKFNDQNVFAEPKGRDLKNSRMLEYMDGQLGAASGNAPQTSGAAAATTVTTTTGGVDSPIRRASWQGTQTDPYVTDYTFDADSASGLTITTSSSTNPVGSPPVTTVTPWNAISNQNGATLDTLADGTYSIVNNGITFSFDVSGARSLDDIATALDSAYAVATTTTGSVVSPAVTNPTVSIVSDSAITAAGGLGLGTHQITADTNGITLGGADRELVEYESVFGSRRGRHAVGGFRERDSPFL